VKKLGRISVKTLGTGELTGESAGLGEKRGAMMELRYWAGFGVVLIAAWSASAHAQINRAPAGIDQKPILSQVGPNEELNDVRASKPDQSPADQIR
jgi:hypothetical protein